GGTGECVINTVPAAFAARMALCAEGLAYGQSEFAEFGIEREPSRLVRPARVRGVPMAFECRTEQVLRFGKGEPGAGNMVIVRVVGVYVADGVLNDRGHVDPGAIDAVGRMGGLTYTRSRDRFELPMGRG
ncbi:MAG: flavin reductase, partial [Phycisphaerales bacterium]